MNKSILSAVAFLGASVVLPAFGDPGDVIAFWTFNGNDPLADASGNGHVLDIALPVSNSGSTFVFDKSDCHIDFSNGTAHFLPDGFDYLRTVENLNCTGQYTDGVTVEFFVRRRSKRIQYRPYIMYHAAGQYNAKTKSNAFALWGGGVTWTGETTGATNGYGQVYGRWNRCGSNSWESDQSKDYPLADFGWHHVAYVMSTDTSIETKNRAVLYVDGVEQYEALVDLAGESSDVGTAFPNFPLVIGQAVYTDYFGKSVTAHADRMDGARFEDEIDDIRITGRVLAPTEFLKSPTFSTADKAVSGAKTWTGAGTTQLWSEDANWSGNAKPTATDGVVIGHEAAVILDAPTTVSTLAVQGDLLFRGWETKLTATGDVTVEQGGVMRPEKQFWYETDPSNRVWIACANLTVAKGGEIDARGGGYASARAGQHKISGAYYYGSGPGASSIDQNSGNWCGSAAHGGFSQLHNIASLPYGNAAEPTTPGSSGALNLSYQIYSAQNGGGVVTVEAMGAVKVDGVISADAPGACTHYGLSDGSGQGGTAFGGSAGGSVWIRCRTFEGAGSVTARGGFSNPVRKGLAPEFVQMYPGAGGRIALDWNETAQATVTDLPFVSARCGLQKSGFYAFYGVANPEFPSNSCLRAGCGTIHLPSGAILTPQTINRFEGRLKNVGSVTLTGDTTLTNYFALSDEGAELHVQGDLTLSGANGRLEVGATEVMERQTNSSKPDYRLCFRRYLSAKTPSLVVDGDFALADGGRFDVHPAATNGVDVLTGALVHVGGNFSVGAACTVYPFTQPTNGATAHFSVGGDFTLAEGGRIGMLGTGYPCQNATKQSFGGSPGGWWTISSQYCYVAPAHAGFGSVLLASLEDSQSHGYNKSYGDALRPERAGSPGAAGYVFELGSACGGGVFHLAAGGKAQVNGIICCDAGLGCNHPGYPSYNDSRNTGGSGGSVLIEAATFAAGPNARISAAGSAAKGGAGGGGRIAVWTGFPWSPSVKAKRITATEEVPAEWADVFSVAAGFDPAMTAAQTPATEGTIRFVTVAKPSGLMLFLK